MLKKPITFTDYNGKNQTKTFYFNLSTAELIKLEMSTMTLSEDMESTTGGLQEHIQDVINSRSGKRIIEMFDMFIDASYGERSEDGRKFSKDGVLPDFKASPAYDALFMELVTNAEAGSKFLNGIMPAELFTAAEQAKQVSMPVQDQRPIIEEITDTQNLMPVDVAPAFRQDAEAEGRISNNLAAHLDGPTGDITDFATKKPREMTKAELLQAYRKKNAPAPKKDYANMSVEELLDLPPEEFELAAGMLK